jgi:ATP-dependent exoDNAse (exonuclease V) alpha subunit
MDKIILTDEFELAFKIANDTNDNLLILGDAGSGKSTFIKYFINNTKKKTVLVAPTGVAAVNIGGTTIHKFFHAPPKPLTHHDVRIINGELLDVYRNIDTVIIDEISMVRADLLDYIDNFFKINLGDNAPFAGKQIIMIGDLCQLPPVIKEGGDKDMIKSLYKTEFFFSSNCLSNSFYHRVPFTKVFRQNNTNFINLLNKIKYDQISEDEIASINKICYNPDVDYFNTTTICSTNAIAKQINEKQLSKLNSKLFVFKAEVEGSFNPNSCPVDEEIFLKVGARVMMRSNDVEGRWYNGTIATVVDISNNLDYIIVQIGNQQFLVNRKEYTSVDYSFSKKDKKIESKPSGKMIQLPVTLAWAMTTHKMQGATLDKVNIDFGNGAFASGQVYVAMSRCRTLKGITLIRPLKRSDVFLDKRILEFYKDYFKNKTKSIEC